MYFQYPLLLRGNRWNAYAAHVVAASMEASLSKGVDIPFVFRRMINILKQMHDTNPSWGPMFIEHRGNISRHFLSKSFNSHTRRMRKAANAGQTNDKYQE